MNKTEAEKFLRDRVAKIKGDATHIALPVEVAKALATTSKPEPVETKETKGKG